MDRARVTLVGEVYDELRWNERRAPSAAPSVDPMGLLNRVLVAVDADDDKVAAELSACLVDLGGARLPTKGWQAALATQLSSNDIVYELARALQAADGARRSP